MVKDFRGRQCNIEVAGNKENPGRSKSKDKRNRERSRRYYPITIFGFMKRSIDVKIASSQEWIDKVSVRFSILFKRPCRL